MPKPSDNEIHVLNHRHEFYYPPPLSLISLSPSTHLLLIYIQTTFSILLSGKLIAYILWSESLSVSPSQFAAECREAAKALIRPVLGKRGPRHRSTRSPHRYTVDRAPSGIFVDSSNLKRIASE